MDGGGDADQGVEEQWLTPKEAGEIVGKEATTIISWIAELRPSEHRLVGRRHLVTRKAIERIARSKPSSRNPPRVSDGSEDDDLRRLRAEINTLRLDLQTVAAERDAVRSELERLRATAADLYRTLGRFVVDVDT